MVHPEWCGKDCNKCNNPCELDNSIPCSPGCCNFDIDGEPQAILCKECDCYKMNHIEDKSFDELDPVIVVDVARSYSDYIIDNAESNPEFGKSWFPVCIDEFFENEYKEVLYEREEVEIKELTEQYDTVKVECQCCGVARDMEKGIYDIMVEEDQEVFCLACKAVVDLKEGLLIG